MKRKDRAYRLARLIQQASRTIESKKKIISKSAFRYQPFPAKTNKRKNQLVDLRSVLISELMKELLGKEYRPGKALEQMWVKL